MQFIPSTWRAYGVDATGDGVADPHNLFDAVHTAVAYRGEARNGSLFSEQLADLTLPTG